MPTLRARVANGRIVIDGTTDLPEGTELNLAVIDGDEMTDEERAALQAEIERGRADILAGRGVPASALDDKQRAEALDELAAEAQKHRLGY